MHDQPRDRWPYAIAFRRDGLNAFQRRACCSRLSLGATGSDSMAQAALLRHANAASARRASLQPWAQSVFGVRCPAEATALAMPVDNAATIEIVGRELDLHAVTKQDLDAVSAHFPAV